MKKKVLALLCVGALGSISVGAISEYDGINGGNPNNKVFDTINLKGAYEKGYTGAGVTVGVFDYPVNLAHPEFSNKTDSRTEGETLNKIDWALLDHGTHVAGIIAANKDGVGMHGVAYDSDILGITIASKVDFETGEFDLNGDNFTFFFNDPNVKIINNSWGYDGSVAQIFKENAQNVDDIRDWYIKEKVMPTLAQHDVLGVFVSGNSGEVDQGLLTMSWLFIPEVKNKILSVGAADATGWSKKEDGGWNVKSDGLVWFSTGARYGEELFLLAPGVDLRSANSDFANSHENYVNMSGTSMAAPLVSGVGALVQQAFPYLSGKQIGDVLLSTANKNITFTDGFTVSINDMDPTDCKVNIFFVGTAPDEKGVTEKLTQYYNDNKEIIYRYHGPVTLDEFLAMNRSIFENVPLESLVGQGMVDAGKAVQGLGAINVRRLGKEDIRTEYTVAGTKMDQAMYTVDTKGYSSVWENDIGEIRAGHIADNPLGEGTLNFDGADADLKDLHDRYEYYQKYKDENFTDWYINQYNAIVDESGVLGLHGGLYKTGEGMLTLKGANTYQGASVVQQGGLAIDGSIAGDAYSEGEGLLLGSGKISGDVYNNGHLMGGNFGTVGSLTMEKDLSGSGSIWVVTDGNSFSSLQVDGKADIQNMKIVSGGLLLPEIEGNIISAGTLIVPQSRGEGTWSEAVSGLLDGTFTVDNNTLSMKTTAVNHTGSNEDVFAAVSDVYGKLSEDNKMEMAPLYGLSAAAAREAMSDMRGNFHLALAADNAMNQDLRNLAARSVWTKADEGIWMDTARSWGTLDGYTRQRNRMSIGIDGQRTERQYWGGLFSYTEAKMNSAVNEGETDSYTFGLYGGKKNGNGQWSGYVSYGKAEVEATRGLRQLETVLTSRYDGQVLGAGAEYAYTLATDGAWHHTPYVRTDISWYKGDGFKEDGGIYALQYDGGSDRYWTGELGWRMEKQEKEGQYGLYLGYERVLDGEQMSGTSSFVAGGSGMAMSGPDLGKDHWKAGVYGQYTGLRDWVFGTGFTKEWGKDRGDFEWQVQVSRKW